MNRRERRALQKQQGKPFPMCLPQQHDHETRDKAEELITRHEKRCPKLDDATTERKAMALFCTCASYLAHLPDTNHRRTILSQATELLTELTLRNARNLTEVQAMEALAGPLTPEFFEAAGATCFHDDERKPS